MSDAVIRIEGLGKKYLLRHQAGGQHYAALRDVIMDGARALGKTLSNNRNALAAPSSREEFWAVKDLSFEIGRGEVVGIIGRNGAGKSTLLKLLSRITEPTTGRITLSGRVASLLEVGTGFHPELTGRENIYLNGAILGMARAEIQRQFDGIVEFSGVEKFLDTPVKRFSSGMYVRLAFAVAAHLETEILIIDEVLAVGDAEFQKKCLGKMQDVAGQGRTILFVSHNMPTVLNLCTRAIQMQTGRVALDGPTEEVIGTYMSGIRSSDSFVDLRSHEGRLSNSQKLLTSIQLFNSAGDPTTNLRMGEDFVVEVTFESPRPVYTPRCGIGLNNHLGMRVVSFGTFFDKTYSAVEKACGGTFRCTVSGVNLCAGMHWLTVTVGEPLNDMDRIEQAIGFEVTAWDVFETGTVPHSSQGVVWCEGQKWELVEN